MARAQASVRLRLSRLLCGLLLLAAGACSPAAPIAGRSSESPPTSGGTAGAAVAVPASEVAAASPTPLPRRTAKIAYPSFTLSQIGVLYAQDEGLYGRYGLDVESVAMVTGGAVAALMSNDLQYVYAASTLLLAAARGLPLRTFWQGSRGPTLELFARPEITGFADLRGKAMNSASGGVSHEIVELLLEKHGVDPRDVGVVVSGSAAAQMEHLRQGLVVASITAPPWTVEARRAGFRHLASAGQEIAYPYSLFATTTARLAEDPEHVRAIIRGSLDAQRLMRQDPAGVIAWITRRFEVDEEIASESYALSIAAQNDHGEVLREAVTNYFRVQKEHPELRDTRYEDVVDMRLLREVWLEQGLR